ncbi:MAG: NAD-dependent epimerase/dehydratase family protein [Nitrospira sp.]|nr:NAD-dependent epimerase/dehydratase family protein [Nitrospira sp.]MBS0477331.1 NAD-dependent epimerase/dehydratase family protein [Pseudomonadota bacterium]
MQALITGGAGFIGSNIARALVGQGWGVRVLDDLSSGYLHNLDGLAVDFRHGDVRDPQAVADAVAGCDVVFHLAASVGNKRSIDDPIDDSSVNVIGTLQVLEAARKAGVRKIVASSSAGIYGELRTMPIHESHPLDPLTPYGASKLCMEKQCLAYAATHGMEAVALRYFNVYGENQRFDAYGNVIPIFVFNALQGRPITIFGDGMQTRDFVNVADVVQANIKAALAPGVSGAFNIASATQTRILDLANAIREGLGIPVEIELGPRRAGDVEHSLADVGAASAAFGYAPRVTMEEGLPEYLAWAKGEAERIRNTERN